MRVRIECAVCAGSGQWPRDDHGRTISLCWHCQGSGSWELDVSGKLERQLRRLLALHRSGEDPRPAA